MSFSDVFKKSFLAEFSGQPVSLKMIAVTLVITLVFSLYLFLFYRLITRKTFYDQEFAIAIAAIAVIVSAIILTIQSSLVVSLGMVGALSIVRFRTAIKSPLDLVFLFWSISVGIICGAGLAGIALGETAVLTVGILVLQEIPLTRAPMLLVVNADDSAAQAAIIETAKRHASHCFVKSRTLENDRLDIVVELRTKDETAILAELGAMPHVLRCSLVSHNGEAAF